ncbi:phospholipid scramblase 3-like isoform X2 [Ambystoma mexicanum]|uniref:phospholipid scramblase 3-like isoform X2 n=1 Tax=Ambystoma mexicanum TaxID=8296 RepID=UPI0037E816A4
MSVHRAQPSPFGHLRRERHISRNEWRVLASQRPQDGRRSPTSGGWSTEAPHKCTMFTEVPAPKGAVRAAANGCAPNGRADVGKQPNEVGGPGPQAAPQSLPERVGGRRGSPALGKSTELDQEVGDALGVGLQLLAGVDQLCITSRDTARETDCLCLHLCGPARSSCIRLHDQNAQEVLRLCRPYRVDVCCLGCCLMEMRAFTAAGKLLGTVCQRWSMFSPLLEVCDSDGQGVMKIHGCWSATRCYTDQEFQVTSKAGYPVAVIWKRWPGYNEDCNMDHDFFGLDVSAALNTCDRALLLAAVFLLNYMFFEMS